MHLLKFKRFLAIGCSHGSLVDPHALKAVLKFSATYKPERRIHLGDVCDLAAFRGGAKGTKDEAEALAPDLAAGARLINEYQPTDVLMGNHDERAWALANHHNAVIAHAAMACRNEYLTAINKAGARLIDHYYVRKSFIELGNYKLMHGWWYNENALRDHAASYGNVIMGHLHTPGIARAQDLGGPIGYCVGMLGDVDKFEYAHRRRATLKWGLGFVWGEYSQKETIVHLEQCESGKAKNWRLPL